MSVSEKDVIRYAQESGFLDFADNLITSSAVIGPEVVTQFYDALASRNFTVEQAEVLINSGALADTNLTYASQDVAYQLQYPIDFYRDNAPVGLNANLGQDVVFNAFLYDDYAPLENPTLNIEAGAFVGITASGAFAYDKSMPFDLSKMDVAPQEPAALTAEEILEQLLGQDEPNDDSLSLNDMQNELSKALLNTDVGEGLGIGAVGFDNVNPEAITDRDYDMSDSMKDSAMALVAELKAAGTDFSKLTDLDGIDGLADEEIASHLIAGAMENREARIENRCINAKPMPPVDNVMAAGIDTKELGEVSQQSLDIIAAEVHGDSFTPEETPLLADNGGCSHTRG